MSSTKINSRNYKKILENMKDKFVVILYYWDNCGHCHELRPIWESSIKSLKKIDKFDICEVEYSNMHYLENDIKTMHAFPSIIVYKNKNIYDEFKENRTPENILAFLKKYVDKPKPKAKSKK